MFPGARIAGGGWAGATGGVADRKPAEPVKPTKSVHSMGYSTVYQISVHGWGVCAFMMHVSNPTGWLADHVSTTDCNSCRSSTGMRQSLVPGTSTATTKRRSPLQPLCSRHRHEGWRCTIPTRPVRHCRNPLVSKMLIPLLMVGTDKRTEDGTSARGTQGGRPGPLPC